MFKEIYMRDYAEDCFNLVTEEESILKEVSDYVKGDSERGDKIYEIVTRNEKTGGDSNIDAMRKLISRKHISLAEKD